MSYQKDRDEFVAVITADVIAEGGQAQNSANLARKLLRQANAYQRLAEIACNEELTPRQETKIRAIKADLVEACKPWKIRPRFSNDPRGACVKVALPSGRGNSWGGPEEGWCVPTR